MNFDQAYQKPEGTAAVSSLCPLAFILILRRLLPRER